MIPHGFWDAKALGLEGVQDGWRIRRTKTCWVDVLWIGMGWRICLTNDQGFYGRSWCYLEKNLWEVVRFANDFDPDAGQEPVGWIREAGTERRACGWYYPANKYGAHQFFDPNCLFCGDEKLAPGGD